MNKKVYIRPTTEIVSLAGMRIMGMADPSEHPPVMMTRSPVF